MRTGRSSSLFLVAALACAACACARVAGAADAVVDAKRKAAADLLRDNKAAEAVALLREVVAATDPDSYKDHLQLARAYDKSNQPGPAVDAYRRTLELASLATADERAARAEAERRLAALDVRTQKVIAAEEEFLKKLDALERDAIAARDVRAVERVFRVKAGLFKAAGRTDRGGAHVVAAAGWQDSGFDVKAGATYRVRAVGTSRYLSGVTASPDGGPRPSANGFAPLGMLVGQIDRKPGAQFKLGSNGRFAAESDGRLLLLLNCVDVELKGATGGATVVIERE